MSDLKRLQTVDVEYGAAWVCVSPWVMVFAQQYPSEQDLTSMSIEELAQVKVFTASDIWKTHGMLPRLSASSLPKRSPSMGGRR